jgi:DNA-binding NarL/FixJ family response regulator
MIETEPGWEVCGEAATVDEGMQQFRKAAPTIAIVDISLGNGDGLDLVRRIRDQGTPTRVLVLSMYDEMLYAERSLRAGAHGYLSKQRPSEEVISAIHAVLDDDIYLSARMSRSLLRRAATGGVRLGDEPVKSLSDRELQVFRLIGQGCNTATIAKQLHLSANTIGTYRERLKIKFNVPDGAALARLAMQWIMDNN